MCEASQVGDQMLCACGLAWDVADTDPPKCRRQRHVEPGHVPPAVRRATAADAYTGPERRRGVTLPAELPVEVALDMVHAANRAWDHTGPAGPMGAISKEVASMRAAYRVLLDRLT